MPALAADERAGRLSVASEVSISPDHLPEQGVLVVALDARFRFQVSRMPGVDRAQRTANTPQQKP